MSLGQYDNLPPTQAAVEKMYARLDQTEAVGGGGGQEYRVLDVLEEYFGRTGGDVGIELPRECGEALAGVFFGEEC